MARLPRLLELYDKIMASEYHLIFIQINEAHSSKWPLGLSHHPSVHEDIKDRLSRARQFIETYKFPYPVYVDKWTDDYERAYHAWPDQYVVIDSTTGNIMSYSEYSDQALITNDYATLLENL